MTPPLVPPESAPSLEAALRRGGILKDIPAADKRTALEAIVERVPLPEGVSRKRVLDEVLRRESLHTTGIGKGLGLPHCHYHGDALKEPIVALAFPDRPVDFDAIDRKPVRAIFLIISPPDPSAHILVFAAIARLLDQCPSATDPLSSPETIFSAARRVDEGAARKS